MSSQMTAHVIESFGDPDVFERTTVDVPDPGPNEVHVEVVEPGDELADVAVGTRHPGGESRPPTNGSDVYR